MKLAIVTTHPIQYNAPLFRLLSKEQGLHIKVFYTWSQTESGAKYDPNFGKVIEWDIPLLDGYEYSFIDNVAKDPGSHHYRGINNPRLIEEIQAWKPQCLLVFGWSFKSNLACLRFFKGKIPVLFRGDSTLLNEKSGLKKMLRRAFLTWVYRHIDYALYVGRYNKNYFQAHGLKNDQLVFVPHAIDNQRFSENDAAKNEEAKVRRTELGIEANDMVILFAGKLERIKDPHFILRLAQMEKSPKIKFLIVGNGHLEKELKDQAEGDLRIIFLGFQNQQSMPVLYRMADVYVLPSVSETWGLAINEAMACHRAVIASEKVGCVPDLVIHDQTGWKFQPGEKGEIEVAYLLKKFLYDPSVLQKVGENAFNKVQEYAYPTIIKNMKSLLNRIANKDEIKAALI